jgi:hypothetical protein
MAGVREDHSVPTNFEDVFYVLGGHTEGRGKSIWGDQGLISYPCHLNSFFFPPDTQCDHAYIYHYVQYDH